MSAHQCDHICWQCVDWSAMFAMNLLRLEIIIHIRRFVLHTKYFRRKKWWKPFIVWRSYVLINNFFLSCLLRIILDTIETIHSRCRNACHGDTNAKFCTRAFLLLLFSCTSLRNRRESMDISWKCELKHKAITKTWINRRYSRTMIVWWIPRNSAFGIGGVLA